MQAIAPESQNYLLRFLIVSAASVAASWIGFLLLPLGGSATLIWPPSAVGIAVLFLYGYDLWPAILLSIFAMFMLRNGNVPFDVSIAVADTIEAAIGAYFLRIYVGLDPRIARLRDALGLLVACIAPTLVSAFIISLSSYYLGRIGIEDIETTFAAVWIGHTVSALTSVPFLIRWLYRPYFNKSRLEIVEGAVIFTSISVCTYLMFWTSISSIGSISLVYVLIIPLIWASLRTGPRGTTLSLTLVAIISTSGILYGHAPESVTRNPQAIFLLQVLLGVLDIIFLLFTAIVEERKEAILSLQSSVGKLEDAIQKIRMEDQAKTNFLAILAHELRNPLSPIFTSVDLMKEDEGKAVDPALVDIIETHARTISLLLDDLLDISRITQNKFELKREYLELSGLVKRSVQTVESLIKLRKHKLIITPSQDAMYLDADPVRIEQILVNLLNNACKYTDPGGRITLTSTKEGRYAVIRVEDTGIGIASDHLAGIFEPFGQSGRVTRQPGGLGIGLSLTKRLVELHGGTIEVYSAGEGKGSTFTVRIPLAVEQDTGARAAAKSFVDRLRGKTVVSQRILIVDDNEPAAKGLAALLNRRGHTTKIAYTGAEALKKIESFKPETVILDIGLPDMSGLEVAQKIRAGNVQGIRLIALTGYGQEEDKEKSRAAGFDAHLIKPVSLADVEAVL